MDQRMHEYDGCQSSYQGCGMDQGMNGYDGYRSSSQYGGFGYDVQQDHCVNNQEAYANNQEAYHQGPYTNNQGSYHHQQWNNNLQDPYSSSSQYEDDETQFLLQQIMERLTRFEKRVEEQREEDERVLDGVVDEVLEPPKEEEMVSSSSTSKATFEAHCEVTNQSHIDEMKLEENERLLEDFVKRLTSPNEGCANDEGCAKDDSNEQASETLTKEKCDHLKVKESLQVLLESEDLGRFYSKIDHLRIILDNKAILGDLLQEFEEEQSSNLHMRTMFEEAPSIEKKETIRSMDEPQVDHMVKTTNVLMHVLPSVVEPLEKLQPPKHARRKRRKRRKKPKKTKDRGIAPKPPLLTFTPLRFVDGKLECKVSSKGGHKPFSKVRILLSPSSKGDDWSAINKAMMKTFSMKLGDRGPLSKPKVPNG